MPRFSSLRWRPEANKIYLPSGFVITMPEPAAEDKKRTRLENQLLEQTARSQRSGGGRFAHPCLKAYTARKMGQEAWEIERTAVKQKLREYEEKKRGLRGTCPHDLPNREARPNINRDELTDMKWDMRQKEKNGQLNLHCGLCAMDYCKNRRWMDREGIELIDILPGRAAARKCSSVQFT